MTTPPTKPVIGISMGDPAGIGPEIIVKALLREKVRGICRPVVVGDAAVIANAGRLVGADLAVRTVTQVCDAVFEPGTIEVLDLNNVDLAHLELGKVSAMAGNAAFEAVRTMISLAASGEIQATVTAPI